MLARLDTDKKRKYYLLDDETGSKDRDTILQILIRVKRELSMAGATEQIRDAYFQLVRGKAVKLPQGYDEWETDIKFWADTCFRTRSHLLRDD